MGNQVSRQKNMNFEDIQYIIKNNKNYLLINILNNNEQNCLIQNTLPYEKEEIILNKCIENGKTNIQIVIYGKNCSDESVDKKYEQLFRLGFENVFIYRGGLFEWLLLQDIYGENEFPTTNKEFDLLKFKPPKILNTNYIEYGLD